MLDLNKVYQAQEVLKPLIVKTPIVKARHLDEDMNVYLKCENLQLTGSFKIRGAAYFISQLSDEQKKKGVIAWSAGNHAQGVALAAQLNGVPATICIPEDGAVYKIEETKRYGARVVLSKGVFDDAMREALAIRDQEDLITLPPFNDEHVVIGQATIGLEILDELKDIDAVVVPIGGGGLISGIAFVIKTLLPNCKVYGVEAKGAASMKQSMEDNKVSVLTAVDTIADGIAVKAPSDLTFEMTKKYVDGLMTVSDKEIADAILHLMETNHLVVEGAGAAAFAAIKTGKIPKHKNILCMVSGGNIDIELLNTILRQALFSDKRLVQLNIEIIDKVGTLQDLVTTIAAEKGNIVSVSHDRLDPMLNINQCIARITFEVSKKEYAERIEKKIKEKGYILR